MYDHITFLVNLLYKVSYSLKERILSEISSLCVMNTMHAYIALL